VLAASALDLNGLDWTPDAVPLLIIFATVIQAIGFSFGTKEMAQSVDTAPYWTSREKWEMVQHFKRESGHCPTRKGWDADVFNLGSNAKRARPDWNWVLFDAVAVAHGDYVAHRNAERESTKRLALYAQYLAALSAIRERHYERFSCCIEAAVEKEWLLRESPAPRKLGFFDRPEIDDGDEERPELPRWKMLLYQALVFVLVLSFWASFYGFYWSSDLADTVTGGIDSLRNTEWYWYSAIVVFVAALTVINHVEILENLQSFGSAVCFVATGCRVDPDIETKFETPPWTESEHEEHREEDGDGDLLDVDGKGQCVVTHSQSGLSFEISNGSNSNEFVE